MGVALIADVRQHNRFGFSFGVVFGDEVCEDLAGLTVGEVAEVSEVAFNNLRRPPGHFLPIFVVVGFQKIEVAVFNVFK